jgi:hypothetical protein
MAVRKRQESGSNLVQVSSRLPMEQSKELEDFAWQHRMTTAATITLLLGKALNAEKGVEYKPERQEGNDDAEQ